MSFISLPPVRQSVRRLSTPLLATALCALLLPAALLAQTNATGSISGRVTDPSGAVVPAAAVTLTSPGASIHRSVATNSTGRFLFSNLTPGYYNLKIVHAGFESLTTARNLVTTGHILSLSFALKIGASTQTVEVNGASGPALQTLNSTMGATMTASTLIQLPSVSGDVTSLMNLQATSAPSFGVRGDITSGSVGGSTPDQNTFLLNGGTNTSGLEGDNGYINNFSGNQRGVVPTPIETIQQFTVNTNNMTSDFSTSSGAEVLAVTKRGYNTWHGSVYDFLQSSVLNANGWDNNINGVPRPKTHQNRFGFDLGGVILPKMLGGRTYFYFDYQGFRFPQAVPYDTWVPSPLLRQGIIQIKTSAGIQQFNLANGKLAACGPQGTGLCDPRQLGMSSAVSQIWSKYMPLPNESIASNDPTGGDQLNLLGYRGMINTPQANDFMTGRFDHDFGSNWHFMGTYTYFKNYSPVKSEVDIGGLVAGDKFGVPAAVSENTNQPRVLVASLTGSITPDFTNVFHFTYTRNQWSWLRNGLIPELPGMPGIAEINGEGRYTELNPANVDTQDARRRDWYEHNYDYRDEVSWVDGNHLFQFGGDWLHEWWHFNRFDNVVGGLTSLVYEISGAALHMTPAYQPPTCGGGITVDCLDGGTAGAAELGTWNTYYADLLGIVDHSSIVDTRTGANLTLNPPGTPEASYVVVDTPDLYFTDTWHLLPTLTLTYGLNWGVQMPPYALNGDQDVAVLPNGKPFTYEAWLANRVQAAENGKVYLPTIGWTPVGALHEKYPFAPYYGEFAPHVSAAWNPAWNNWFAGDHDLVIRGGFGRFFARDFGINVISNPGLGDGFLQPVSCTGPVGVAFTGSSGVTHPAGSCTGQGGVDPSNSFRLGPDGLTVPLPAPAQTLQSPVQPGIGTTPYATLVDMMDPNFRPGVSNELDFSIQRQFGQRTTLELGYVGVWANHLFQGAGMNSVPYMMKLGGQTFAQAYLNLYREMSSGAAITPQPFFETALAGTNYCTNGTGANVPCGSAGASFPNYTQAVVANEGPNITSQSVTSLWSDLDSQWNFGPALYSTNQGFYVYANTSDGFSNYQAMVVKLKVRAARGLTFNSNFTYGHDLGTIGLAQTYTLDTPDNVYNLRADWTPEPWDEKFVLNFIGTYQLPWYQGQHGWLGRLIGGWSVAPIITIASGLPLEVYSGSFQEGGAGWAENGASAVPVNFGNGNWNTSPITGVVLPEPTATSPNGNPNAVGINGNPDQGGAGVNMFGSQAINVYNHFRPYLLGLDGAPSPDGEFRGLSRWNADLGLNKTTAITERVRMTIFAQAFNLFNHMEYNNPSMDLQSPSSWGVLYGQFNQPRVIQMGLRFWF